MLVYHMNKHASLNFSSTEESLVEVCLSLIVSDLQFWTMFQKVNLGCNKTTSWKDTGKDIG